MNHLLSAAALAAGLATLVSQAALAAPASQESAHVVTSGETLGGIANRAGVSASAIAKANGLDAPYVVRVGQTLQIPRGAATPAKVDASAPTADTTSHVVAPGETLGGIANRAGVARVLIAEANGLQAPYIVKVGQKLVIPRTRHHKVVAGDTSFALSYKYALPWEQIAVSNGLDPKAPLKAGQDLVIPTVTSGAKISAAPSPATSASNASAVAREAKAASARFAWPVSGKIRRDFATGANNHDGIDIIAPAGTMVHAAAAGTVRFAGFEKEQFGNLVVLDHGNGWFTAYAFLNRTMVQQGAKVTAGQRIGLVGNTGQAKGTELHFEVRRDGKPVDPLDELPKAP